MHSNRMHPKLVVQFFVNLLFVLTPFDAIDTSFFVSSQPTSTPPKCPLAILASRHVSER